MSETRREILRNIAIAVTVAGDSALMPRSTCTMQVARSKAADQEASTSRSCSMLTSTHGAATVGNDHSGR